MRESILAARLDGASSGTGRSTMEFRFRPDDPTFAGHFPGHPILPGVFQLEMSRVAAEIVLNCPLALREIKRAKFTRPILPDELVRVDLKLSETGAEINAQAELSVGGQRAGEVFLQLCRSA